MGARQIIPARHQFPSSSKLSGTQASREEGVVGRRMAGCENQMSAQPASDLPWQTFQGQQKSGNSCSVLNQQQDSCSNGATARRGGILKHLEEDEVAALGCADILRASEEDPEFLLAELFALAQKLPESNMYKKKLIKKVSIPHFPHHVLNG